MKRIRIFTSKEHPTGMVLDADTGEVVDAVRAAAVSLSVDNMPAASLELFVAEVDVDVDLDHVQWFGLDRVPIEALRAELARREPHPPQTASRRLMGRIPTAGEVATRLTDLARRAELDTRTLKDFERATAATRYVRERLVQLVNVLNTPGLPHIRDALATVLVETGREIAPPPPRPLRLHKTCPHRRGNRRRHRRKT